MRLAERTVAGTRESKSPGMSVAPTPRKMCSVEGEAHTHLAAVVLPSLENDKSLTNTCPHAC